MTRDEVILRRHRCASCGLVYLSAQVVVSDELEGQLLDLFESGPDAGSPKPTTSSEPMPSASAI